MQPGGRASHVRLLGNHDEVLQLRKAHDPELSTATQIERVLDRRPAIAQSRGMAIELLGSAEVAAMRRAGRAAAATLANGIRSVGEVEGGGDDAVGVDAVVAVDVVNRAGLAEPGDAGTIQMLPAGIVGWALEAERCETT